MQAQLDELKKMKVLRLSRMAKEEMKYSLLDSGATRAMRGRKKGERTETYEKVRVTLANRQQVEMKMAPSGIMVMEEEEGNHPDEHSSRPAWLHHPLGPRQDEVDTPTPK